MKRKWVKGRLVRKENGVSFRVKGHYRGYYGTRGVKK